LAARRDEHGYQVVAVGNPARFHARNLPFDISEPTDTMNFVTQFITPGEAQSVSILTAWPTWPTAVGASGRELLAYDTGVPPRFSM
jgi:hypothetical protein